MNGHQCRIARAHLKLSLDDLAGRLKGKVGRRTLVDFEADARKPQKATVEALEAIFVAAGMVFHDDGVNVTFTPPKVKPKRK